MKVIKNDQDAVLDMWPKKAILRRSCLCMGSKPHAHLAEVQQVQRPLQECMTKGKVGGNEVAETAKGYISWTKYFGILF